MSSSQNTVITIKFYDLSLNYLPQFDINAVLQGTDGDSSSQIYQLESIVSSNFQQALNQIGFLTDGFTTSPPTNTAQQVYSQVVANMDQIATLSPTAGAGTTETSSFVGQIPGENVSFTIAYGTHAGSSNYIMTASDFTLLQTNPQANVAVTNVISTTAAPTISYAQLEQLIISAGVQQYVSPSTITQQPNINYYSITVSNKSGQTQSFILSYNDYVSFYSSYLNNLVSSTPTSGPSNASLQDAINYAISGTSTSQAYQPSNQTPASSQTSTISLSNGTQESLPAGTYTIVAKNSDGSFNLMDSKGNVWQFITQNSVLNLESTPGFTINDPNAIMQSATPPPGSVVLPGNLQQPATTPTGTQTLQYQTPEQELQIIQMQINAAKSQSSSTIPKGVTFNKNSLWQNPIGVGVALFSGIFGFNLIMPHLKLGQKLKRHRRR